MRAAGLLLLAALALGCDDDPTAPKPMTELKPVAGPPPVPAPPKPAPLPETVEPAEPPAKHSAEAAPVKFSLNKHHRAHLDQVVMLSKEAGDIEISHRPVVKYTTGDALAKGQAPSMLDWPVMFFARKNGALTVRFANKKEKWEGGAGWLAVVLDASRSSGFEKLAMAFPGGGRAKSKASVAPEIGNLVVDGASSFRVRSLAAEKAWKLTITTSAADGEVVVPAIALLTDKLPGVREVTLDGKPVSFHTAVLGVGTYKLAGAAALWMTVPAVDGMKIADLEVELSPL